MKNYQRIVLATAIFALAGAANAVNIVGTQSAKDGDEFYIEVGKSNVPFGPHKRNKAGIGASNSAFAGASMRVDFQALTSASKTTSVHDKGTTIYQLADPIIEKGKWYEFHRKIGNFNFVKVGSGDVWIGEWSRKGGPEFANRQVYYVGEHDGTSMPESGTAYYKTVGINKFTGNNLLTGTLKATFAGTNSKLDGSIHNADMTLTLQNTKIDLQHATFSGHATVANAIGNGNVQGHFFGNQAAALAGIAEFENKNLNTAFGGTKQ